MIDITLYSSYIGITLLKCTTQAFQSAISVLKMNRCIFNKSTNQWEIPFYKYDIIKESLENIDVINDKVDKSLMDEYEAGNPQIELSTERNIPDWSLLNFKPLKGKAPYEDFQKIDISSCLNKSRYALFLGCGSGKSYIASAIIAHYYLKWHKVSKVLLITTSIGVRNLYHEILKFIKGLDENKITIADKDNRDPFKDDKDIIITSYNSFRLICNYYKKKLNIKSKFPRKPFLPISKWAQEKDCLLLLDESHEIMHSDSQKGYFVALHSEDFRYRYLFSGTPADSPEKLYNQFKTLDPWLVYGLSFAQWKDKMANLGTKFAASAIRSWKQDELKKSNERFVSKYGIYRDTEDIIDLPNKFEKKIYISMNPHHRSLYEDIIKEDIQGSVSKGTRDIFNRFPYMMLSVDNPFLLDKHKEKFSNNLITELNNFKESYLEKENAIRDILDDHPDEKGIIWCIHPLTIEMLNKQFSSYNPLIIKGDTDKSLRDDILNTFKISTKNKLLIASSLIVNSSVTLTEATFQIYVERSFSYIPYSQSSQRIYRAGQDKDVYNYILLYDKSIDVLLDKSLSSKGELISGLVNKDFLTQSQWNQIFNCEETTNIDF